MLFYDIGFWVVLYSCLTRSMAELNHRDPGSTALTRTFTAISTAPAASIIADDINTSELGNPSDSTWIAKLANVTDGLPTSFLDNNDTLTIDNATTQDNRGRRLQRLNKLFPGIFWDKAYPDKDDQSCTPAQFNILEMATRVAVRLTQYSPSNLEDPAFQKYFVTDGLVGGRWSSGANRGRYMQLINNLKQIAEFPSKGDSKGHMTQKWRIAYLCGRIPDEYDRCARNPLIPAYTVRRNPDGKSEFGTVVIICPLFWTQSFVDMITASHDKLDTSMLDDPDLYTFERSIMHEWMHCSPPVGYSEHITDIDKDDPGKAVYGSTRSHDRAWLKMNNKDPNPEIVLNADNYAWTWMYREYARVWGWTDVDSSANNTYTESDIWANLTGSIDPPLNCVQNSTGIDCSYIGMSYQDWMIDQGVACNCSGIICSTNSPRCCSSQTCPNCDAIRANASELADVPSCCASNACLWDLGSNINGGIP